MKKLLALCLSVVLIAVGAAVSVSAEKVAGTVYSGLKTSIMDGTNTSGITISTNDDGDLSIDQGSSDTSCQTNWLTDASGNEIAVKDFVWEFDYSTTNSWSNARLFFRANSGWGSGDYCLWINGSDNTWGCAGGQADYSDCRVSLTENDKQGANAVAIKPYVIALDTVHHVKLQVIGKEVTLWITPEGSEQGEPLISATVEAMAEEGKLQFMAYSAGVFTIANSVVTELVDEGADNADTADHFLAPMLAVAVASLGIVFVTKKR